MPDATALELIGHEVRAAVDDIGPDSRVKTIFTRSQATLDVAPEQAREVLRFLKEDYAEPYDMLASLHGCDYLPEEPRLGIHYQLLSMERCERMNVKTRVSPDEARVPSVIDVYPTANFQEREVWDMFGVWFEGHPDMRRILLPEDYEGHPLRRDFPMGGEPVFFTYNEPKFPRWYD